MRVNGIRCDPVADADTSIGRLQDAFQQSHRLGLAAGVLMEQRQVTASQAFELLRVWGLGHARTISDAAEEVLWAGDLPPDVTNP